jgi:pyruvate/2-oxoglutarate dehydrogenase complex dihydrolipoamide dehydrogenase (E3) component
MIKNKYDIIVIGAGSAGLTIAIGGAQIGAKVLLIEKSKIGGDCTHYGCIPSKSLISISKKIKTIKQFDKNYKLDLKKILSDVQNTVDKIYSHETPKEIKKFGIDIEIGNPKFISKNQITINDKIYTGNKIAITTGTRAKVPKIKGLDKIKYMTNHNIFNPTKYKTLTIIGGGPIGCELAQAFNNLGIKINLINFSEYILNREDKQASQLVQTQFKKENINILNNKNTIEIKKINNKIITIFKDNTSDKIESVESDEILISVGRIPNIENLDLEKADVDYDEKGIFINNKTQTSNKLIYASGDITRGWQFTHFANHQAKITLSNIIFKLPFKYETKVIPRVTYTSPEIASIGITLDETDKNIEQKIKNKEILILTKQYSQIDRAITDNNTTGFFKIIVDKKGNILGACLVGSGSGELISEIALAMKNNIKITALSDTIHPYPTYGYGLRNCADQFRSLNFTQTQKKWIKTIFRLNGK